jgi:gamma-tubulin complex component 3
MTATVPSSDGESNHVADGTGLTLLRLGLWTGEMQLKIKMMVEVVEDAKCKHLYHFARH